MSKNSIPRNEQLGQILKSLTHFYSDENLKLIRLLRSKGVPMKEIAEYLDVVPSALRNRFQRRGETL
jgi:DNA-binding transcriptional MerR regulator